MDGMLVYLFDIERFFELLHQNKATCLLHETEATLGAPLDGHYLKVPEEQRRVVPTSDLFYL